MDKTIGNEKYEQNRLLFVLLIILFIFSSTYGFGYFLYSVLNDVFAMVTYRFWKPPETYAFYRYAKDVILVLMYIYILKINSFNIPEKIMKLIFVFLIYILWGLIRGNSVFYVIGGIRCFWSAIFIYFYMTKYYFDKKLLYGIFFSVVFTTILNVISVVIQIIMFGNKDFLNIGSGGYRYMGLFTSCYTLGYFSLGCVIFLNNFYDFFKGKLRFLYFVTLALLIFLSLASGTRFTIMGIMIVVVMRLLQNMRIDHAGKIVLLFTVGLLVVSIFYTAVTSQVGRGDAMVSGQGRVDYWIYIFENYNILDLLIGRGFGYGTNAATQLGGIGDVTPDSTLNAIVAQFGILGAIIFLIMFFRFFIGKLNNNKDAFFSNLGVIIILIVGAMMATNLFEQPPFVLYASVALLGDYKEEKRR